MALRRMGAKRTKKAESLRAQCRNTVHVCAELLSCDTRLRRCKIIVYMSEPLRLSHRMGEVQLRGPAKVMEHYAGLANGDYTNILHKTLLQLEDVSSMCKIGVSFTDLGFKCGDTKALSDPRVCASIADEQSMLAEVMEFTLNLVKFRSLSMAHHSHCSPGLFALLTSADESHRQAGLREAERAWSAIDAAGRKSKDMSQVAKLLGDIPFTAWVWPREVFLSLRQFSFRLIPEQTADTIRTLFCGFGHSLVNEKCINQVKDQYRDAKGTKICRERRLHTPVATGLLSNLYERKELQVRDASVASASVEGRPGCLPKAAFESQGSTPSVSDALLKEVMGGAPSWPSFTPQSSHGIVSAWRLLLHMHESGRWGDAALAWKSIFVRERVILEKASSGDMWLVLHSGAFCVLCASVAVKSISGRMRVASLGAKFELSFIPITDFDEFHIWALEPVGPNRRCYGIGLPYDSDVLHLKLSGKSVSILEHSARSAFKGVGDSWMKKLISLLGLRGEDFGVTGDSALAHAELLVTGHPSRPRRGGDCSDHGFADRAGVYRQQIHGLGWRCARPSVGKKDMQSVNSKNDGATIASNDKAYMQNRTPWKHAEEHLALLHGEPSATKPAAAASSSNKATSSSSCAGAKRGGKQIRVDTLNLRVARTRLPKFKGCLIQDYPQKNSFQVYYSESVRFPRSKHFTFGAAWAEGQCLLSCLQWAWGRHCEHTSTECPLLFLDEPCPPFLLRSLGAFFLGGIEANSMTGISCQA